MADQSACQPAPRGGGPPSNPADRSGGRVENPPQVRNLPHITLLLLLLFLASAAHAEIIDRIAVSVGNRVITLSDLERQIRVSAFLSGGKPDLAPAARRTMADRMVEQMLIRRELGTGSYPTPAADELDRELRTFRARLHPDAGEFARALADAGLSEADLKKELLWELTLTRFVAMRFTPGVQVSAEETQKYFDTVVAPLARTAHPDQPLSIDDYRDEIETKLSGERADREMDHWLKEARGRTAVIFHEEAFQ